MSPFVLDFPGLSESDGLPGLPDKLGLGGLAAGAGAAVAAFSAPGGAGEPLSEDLRARDAAGRMGVFPSAS